MILSFLGAAHEVTGSCFLLEACGKKLIVDCGMKQGEDAYDAQTDLPFVASDIDYVLVTHAHIDHTGRLPLMSKLGFEGTVLATKATADLCNIMLRDSAHIQEFEVEWKNRKAQRAGEPLIEPLYTTEDAVAVCELFEPCSYQEPVALCDGITVRFVDAGHLLGSASIEVTLEEEGQRRVIVFSGDIGNLNQPIIKDPTYLTKADYVVMESTYGDRNHQIEKTDHIKTLADIINTTFARGGNVVIPSFAVGRTQELLYFLRFIKELGMVKINPDFKVYVDSPMAVEATQVFRANVLDCFDKEAMELIQGGVNPLSFRGLETSVSPADSMAINLDNSPKVIISASGMCDAGRIKHHLKHNLWKSKNTVLFVGYQSMGTLGRYILEGAKTVKLFGETIDVKAEILKMPGMSGHADQDGLLVWVKSFTPNPTKVFVAHGSLEASDTFATMLRDDLRIPAETPNFKAKYDLLTGACVDQGEAYQKLTRRRKSKPGGAQERLLEAVARLAALVDRSKGRPNKELAKLANQITDLIDKWES